MRYGYDELLTQIYRSQYDCFSIGRSHMGREILAIKLGSGKTPLIVVGAHHGREFIASQYIMGELEAVSYIHLDVYKRQQLYVDL